VVGDQDVDEGFRWERRRLRVALVAGLAVAVAALVWLAPLYEDRLCTLEARITDTGTAYSPCLCAEQDEMRARYPDALVSWRYRTSAGDCPSQSTSPSTDHRSG
jgi:hypothetical protein